MTNSTPKLLLFFVLLLPVKSVSPWFFTGGYGSEFGVAGASVRWQYALGKNHYLTPSVGLGVNIWSVVLGPTSVPLAGSLGIQQSCGDTHRIAHAVFMGYIWLNYDSVNDVRENVRSTPGLAYRVTYEYYFLAKMNLSPSVLK